MNELRKKLYTAKKLLINQSEVDGKRNTFSGLDSSKSTLLALAQDGLIKFEKPLLSKKYISNYQNTRKTLESELNRKNIASISMSGHHNFQDAKKEFENYLTDKYCGLGKELFEKLQENPEIEIDQPSFQRILATDFANDSLSFVLEFSLEKIQEFLNEKMDLFVTDELELSDDAKHRFFSYEKQKEFLAIGIVKLLNTGYPANSLKIDYLQVFQKEVFLQTNFLETALAMERQGLIEVKNIIETIPVNPVVRTSQDVFKYPTIIHLKVLNKFYPYYDTVLKKHSSATQKQNQEALTPNDKKLKLLEKLKDEWELAPKREEMRRIYNNVQTGKEAKLSHLKVSAWMREFGITDWYELESLFIVFQQEGVITRFKFVGEYE